MALVDLGVGLSPYLNVLKTQYHSEKYFAIVECDKMRYACT